MGAVKFTREVTKILILVWMPLYAPLADSLCPMHKQIDESAQQVSQCHNHQTQGETQATCDCPSCDFVGVIPLAQSTQIDIPFASPWRLRPKIYENIFPILDTPPPQIL